MTLIFAYGSLLDDASRAATLGRHVPCDAPAALCEHAAAWCVTDGRETYLGLVPAGGSVAVGAVFEASVEDVRRLRARERGYRLRRLPRRLFVSPAPAADSHAFVPAARGACRSSPPPSRRYVRLVTRGFRRVRLGRPPPLTGFVGAAHAAPA